MRLTKRQERLAETTFVFDVDGKVVRQVQQKGSWKARSVTIDEMAHLVRRVHAQRILVTGKPGQLLRLVGTFYEPIYAAARLAIEEYLRDRGEIW